MVHGSVVLVCNLSWEFHVREKTSLSCLDFGPCSSHQISQNTALTYIARDSVHFSNVRNDSVSRIVAATFGVQGYVASSVLRAFHSCALCSRNETLCVLCFWLFARGNLDQCHSSVSVLD